MIFTNNRSDIFHKRKTKIGIIDFKPMILSQRKRILAQKKDECIFYIILYSLLLNFS